MHRMARIGIAALTALGAPAIVATSST